MLIRRAEVAGRGPVDLRLRAGRVAEIGPGLATDAGEPVHDAAGAALLPGLHDHHIHLLALAAAERSVRCGPPQVADAPALARTLAEAAPERGWIRGVGYHDSVAGDLDRDDLDRLRADVPLRIQHRSGALWTVNGSGAARLELDAADHPGIERDAEGRPTGRLFRADAWLRTRLGEGAPPALEGVGAGLARRGVTGVTDATPTNGPAELAIFAAAAGTGALPQRLLVMGGVSLPDPTQPHHARGPVKLLLDERALPDFDALSGEVADAHASGRSVAIHCVTRAEIVLATGVLAAAGALPGDRIEHASVAPPDVTELLAPLPLTVVTQPGFVHERGDAYLRDVDPDDRLWLYRCAGFDAAGVPVGAGTDAPFGDPEPWRAMQTAVERRTRGGQPLGPEEAVAPERALALFLGAPEAPGGPARRIEVGAAADLCLLDQPWAQARRDLGAVVVTATWCHGELVWTA